jgi:hypothetical protein
LYIVPRLLSRATGEVTHLDNAISGHPRAILTGASGLGKSSALAFLSAGANAPVLSLADYHPGALPEHLPNETWILLDDIGDPAHVLYLQELARKFPSAKIWAVTRDPKLVPADFAQLELQSFNEREIVSMKGHTARRINRAAQDLIASVQANAGTRELAINPLCLYLLLQVYEPAAIRAPVVEEHVALPMIGGNAATPFDVPQRTRVAQLPARRAQLFDAYVSAKLAAEPDPDFAARALEGIALSTRRGQRATQEHLARGYGLLEQRKAAASSSNIPFCKIFSPRGRSVAIPISLPCVSTWNIPTGARLPCSMQGWAARAMWRASRWKKMIWRLRQTRSRRSTTRRSS